jgi:hypothetical protein
MVSPLSRRSFLARSSVTIAAAGAAVAVPARLGHAMDTADATPELTEEELASVAAMVIHVADAATGELSVMTGTREVRIRNRRLVAQLVRLARV